MYFYGGNEDETTYFHIHLNVGRVNCWERSQRNNIWIDFEGHRVFYMNIQEKETARARRYSLDRKP